ncbi:hypothetical protein Cal7507_5870 [Calothrix sp. PCC 7507]|nr:hypothetical protein Cal7507_5870 [Calothrix sp. PCC 7507]
MKFSYLSSIGYAYVFPVLIVLLKKQEHDYSQFITQILQLYSEKFMARSSIKFLTTSLQN